MIKSKAFTLTEILVVSGLVVVMLTLSTINVIRPQNKAIQTSIVDNLISDISSQQIKSMVGDTSSGGSVTMHGVYFETDRYVLFQGDEYTAGNASNFVVMLPESQSFSSILFPSGQLLFAEKSGEVADFAAGQNTVTLSDSGSGETKVIQINSFGVITSLN